MSEVQLHLVLLGWRRPMAAELTIQAWGRHNPSTEWLRWYALDGGHDEAMPSLCVEHGFAPLVVAKKNVGIARMYAAICAGLLGTDPGPDATNDWLFVLEEDWECVRPLPMDLIRQVLSRDGSWAVRLFGRTKDRRGRLGVKDARPGCPEQPETVWRPEVIAGENCQVGQSYWCHPPTITRLGLADQFARGAGKEPVSIERSCQAGLWVVWPNEPCFWHMEGPGRRQLGGKR